MIYKFRDGYRPPKIEAQVVGRELEKLRLRHGLLTAELVLRAATPKQAPLHNAFPWDDKVAAHEHRLTLAGSLIRAVYAVPEPSDTQFAPTRQFVFVKRDDATEGYTSTFVAMSDDVLRQQVVDRALAELKTWESKYKHLYELAELFVAIDTFQPQSALAVA